MTPMMYRLTELSDVFADACIRNERGEVLFLSLYGRDVGLHQLTAAFHLPPNAGGLREFQLQRADTPGVTSDEVIRVQVGDPQRLEKFSGKFPKGHLFGSLSHMWVYDPLMCKPDKVARSAWILKDGNASDAELYDAAWNIVGQLSTVALLPHWREPVMAMILKLKQVRTDFEHAPVGDVRVCHVALAETFESMISELVKQGVLALDSSVSEYTLRERCAA